MQPPRVLIVEDESLISFLIEETVRQLDWEPVGPAPRLEAAETIIRNESLDGAVLDVKLRGEPVYPLAELLRERRVPFLFVTGYGTRDIDPRFRDRPCVRKPFSTVQLARALQSLAA